MDEDPKPRMTASARGAAWLLTAAENGAWLGTARSPRQTVGVVDPVAVITSSSATVGSCSPVVWLSGRLLGGLRHRYVACGVPTITDRPHVRNPELPGDLAGELTGDVPLICGFFTSGGGWGDLGAGFRGYAQAVPDSPTWSDSHGWTRFCPRRRFV
jgi:hypothetical protein